MSESSPSTDPRRRVASEMAAGIAHEFNNMLASMVGLSDLLRTDPRLPAELVEDAERIYRSTMSGAERVRQIQKIAGRLRPASSLDAVDLSVVLREVQGELATATHQIAISVEGDCTVVAQKTDLADIIQRLVINSMDATEGGGRIELGARRRGNRVQLWVADDGPGIDAEIQDRVFEPFFTTHDQRRGRGLGLAIAEGLTSSFGGTIRVGDAVGGARLEIYLPAVERVVASAPEPKASVPVAAPTRVARVLIVDDDPIIRDVLVRMLRLDGHEGVSAASGEAALEEIARGPFDVVVTDLAMPGMDGMALARELRTRMPEAVVVLSSGWSSEQQSDAGAVENVALMIAKPVEYEAFASTITRALELHREQAASA